MIEPTRSTTQRPPIELLAEVSALSRHFGSDPTFTRGGGGNSSGKADGVLYIKPSGVSLATVTPASLMPLVMEPLLAVVDGMDVASLAGSEAVLKIGLAARLDPADHRRPSVELVFHALLPERIVIHTHPTIVNALTCATGGRQLATELFADDALWIPYTDPGLPLARRIAAERQDHERRTGHSPPPVILLQNHGLIVAGAGVQEIIERSAEVVAAVRGLIERKTLSDEAGAQPSAGDTGTAAEAAPSVAALIAKELGAGGRHVAVLADTSAASLRVGATAAGRAFVRGGPLTPDQIVYAGSWPLLLEATRYTAGADAGADPGAAASPAALMAAGLRSSLVDHLAAGRETPAIIVIEGVGLFAVADTADLAVTVRDVYLDAIRVADGATRLGGIRSLAPDERRFIEQWEAEAYRRGVAASGDMEPGRHRDHQDYDAGTTHRSTPADPDHGAPH